MNPGDDRIARLRQIIARHEDLMLDLVLPVNVPSPSPPAIGSPVTEAEMNEEKVATDEKEDKVENKDRSTLEQIFVRDGENEDSKSKLDNNTLCEKFSMKVFVEEVALRKTMDPGFSTERTVEEIKDEHLLDKKMTFGQFIEILDRVSDDMKFNRDMIHQPDAIVEFENERE